MGDVEVSEVEVETCKKKKKKTEEEEEENEKEIPPDKMDLFGEPAMNNAYLICHNVQVYLHQITSKYLPAPYMYIFEKSLSFLTYLFITSSYKVTIEGQACFVLLHSSASFRIYVASCS